MNGLKSINQFAKLIKTRRRKGVLKDFANALEKTGLQLC